MRYQAEILLLKNKIRLLKGTIRHMWQGLIGIIAVGGVLLYQFFFVIAKAGYGTGATERGVFYTLLLVAAAGLFRVFVNQTPVFRIEAASVLHTYNTGFFRKSLFRKQLFSMLVSALVSGMIACVLSGFLLNLSFLKLWLILTLYSCSCKLLSWIFYHAQGKIRWGVCLAFSLCTFLLFLRSVPAVAVLALSLCAVWMYVRRFLRMNTSKYFERLQSLEAASVALSQNDHARMKQLAEENRPSYVKGPMLYHLNPRKQTALWIKSLLELFRMQGQIVVLLALLLLAGWIVSRTNLFAFLPLLDDPAITRMIAVFCTTAALSGLYQLLVKQAKTVSDKRKLGLSLPYSTRQIILSYGTTALILNLFLILTISLLYATFSIRLIPLFFGEAIAYLVPCCTQLYETKFQRGATSFS
ncbi:MAG: hypothetical protein IJ214_03890, partial [Clostridia bacterium]|nr:hypothetical protein [Clostridia bacterium]